MSDTQILLPNDHWKLKPQHYQNKESLYANSDDFYQAFITLYTYEYVLENEGLFKALNNKFNIASKS